MAWTAPVTWVAQALTAALLNEQISDNMNETAPGKASAAGRMIITDGANSIVERIPSQVDVDTSETTSGTNYTDLATSGPAITATTGTNAIVIISAQMSNDTGGQQCRVGVDVSSATTIAAADEDSIAYESSNAIDIIRMSTIIMFDGLTAGSNVFKMEYRVTGGTGTFLRRNIIVIPL